jgi:hypothetical protein
MAFGYTSTEWARIANTTIQDVLREEEDLTMRSRPVYAMMKKKGRVKYNAGGDGFKWPIKNKRVLMTTNNGEQPIDFVRTNKWGTANLGWAGYVVADQITKRERLINKTNAAVINIFSRMASSLAEDLEDQFAEELYVDSSASGNSQRFTGLESMFAATQTIDITSTSGAARTATAADPTAYPNDTYAGNSTVLAALGGAWGTQGDINKTWPFGNGGLNQEAYDCWTPVIVNYTSTAFGGSTWAANCVKAMRFGLDAVNTKNQMKYGQIDMILLDRGLFRQFKDTLDSKERRIITSGNELYAMGFTDQIEQDGATILTEFGIPAGVGYGLKIKAIELRSMQDQIFKADGPDYSFDNQAWRFIVDCHGQFRFMSPRNFIKYVTLA